MFFTIQLLRIEIFLHFNKIKHLLIFKNIVYLNCPNNDIIFTEQSS